MSEQNTKLVLAQYLPHVLLTGGYMISNPNLWDGFNRRFSGVWNVGVTLTVPVWNWMESKYKLRGSKAMTTIARLDLADLQEKIHLQAGDQTLNGEEALVFARSRAYADGDYTRQRNQRKVIDAIIHKGLEAPATDLAGLIQASTKFLTTDSAMDFDFILSLAELIRHNNDYPVTIYSANIPSYPDMIGDVSYVIAEDAGVAEMSRIFMEGGDISQVATN